MGVCAAEGVVTLEDEVDSLAQRWAVERALRGAAGVTELAWTANVPGESTRQSSTAG